MEIISTLWKGYFCHMQETSRAECELISYISNYIFIKDTTESSTSASYLDVLLSIYADGKLTTQLYDKRDDFSFTIVNFPYIYIATSHYHLHTGYTYLNWFDMQGSVLHTISFWVEVDYWQTSWCYRDFYSLVWCQRWPLQWSNL